MWLQKDGAGVISDIVGLTLVSCNKKHTVLVKEIKNTEELYKKLTKSYVPGWEQKVDFDFISEQVEWVDEDYNKWKEHSHIASFKDFSKYYNMFNQWQKKHPKLISELDRKDTEPFDYYLKQSPPVHASEAGTSYTQYGAASADDTKHELPGKRPLGSNTSDCDTLNPHHRDDHQGDVGAMGDANDSSAECCGCVIL